MADNRYGFIKPLLDAHTLGINAAAQLLKECGYPVVVADERIEKAMQELRQSDHLESVLAWLDHEAITHLGLSYRLDTEDALRLLHILIEALKDRKLLANEGGAIRQIYFAGLASTCQRVENTFKGLIKTFEGAESVRSFLLSMDVPEDKIPPDVIGGSRYDERLYAFGKELIESGSYKHYRPVKRSGYPDYGTHNDSLVKRLKTHPEFSEVPLMRAHVGPYDASKTRRENVEEFLRWTKQLAQGGYLDILSIGSSQLTQSRFNEDWGDSHNGGGVPIQTPEEYRQIAKAAKPMLVRTYAGTKDVPKLARIHEETHNIVWHALSFWWFNELDERGPNDLYTNLQEHIETLKYIASTSKPFEPNVPHHFAFRGADDVTYIVSAYLSAKLAKKMGIKTFICQNMLNTPRSTWGIQDLAKSRALITLIRRLEGSDFKVYLQPRAGLDYFRPDLEEAKIQLAAVSALMDDIEPDDPNSPPIIHVVSYSEAVHLATPEIIEESIQITQSALKAYRALKTQGRVEDMAKNPDVLERTQDLLRSAKIVIEGIESSLDDPYSAEGFYLIFAAGFLPVPYLWRKTDEFRYAKAWNTKPIKGAVKVVDEKGRIVSSEQLVSVAKNHLDEVRRQLQTIQFKSIQ